MKVTALPPKEFADLPLEMARQENEVFQLDDGDEVCCYHCLSQGDRTTHKKGEAFLAGPGHTPYNAEANYICREHLDADAVIWPCEEA